MKSVINLKLSNTTAGDDPYNFDNEYKVMETIATYLQGLDDDTLCANLEDFHQEYGLGDTIDYQEYLDLDLFGDLGI